MPTTAIHTNVTWQAALAVDQWAAARTDADSIIILEDLAVRSLWVSKTPVPLAGNIEINLWQTIQAGLLQKVERFLTLETRWPGSRDDWLFEILHHPVLGLDKQNLAMLCVRFYRMKNEPSFRQFILKEPASLDLSDQPVRHVVEELQKLFREENGSRQAILQFLRQKAADRKSRKILDQLAAAENDNTNFLVKPDDEQGIAVRAALPTTVSVQRVLICGYQKNEYNFPSGKDVTFISIPEEKPKEPVPHFSLRPKVQLLPENWLKDILSNYKLSVSHLNTLLRCPLSFYFEVILRSPAEKHPSMAFGSAVHEVLEKAFRHMLRNEHREFPGTSEINAIFEQSMEKYRAYFDQSVYGRKLEYGKQVLQRHFGDFAAEWNRIATIERHVKASIDGVPVHGFIDKIEFDRHRASIVDYKTGKAEGKEHRFKPPGHNSAQTEFEHAFGGNYWRQAVFYYLLVMHDHTTKWKPSKVIFEYLEPEDKRDKRVEIIPTAAEQEAVKGQIRQAWQVLEMRAFDTGCGQAGCRWCRFVVENDHH